MVTKVTNRWCPLKQGAFLKENFFKQHKAGGKAAWFANKIIAGSFCFQGPEALGNIVV